MKAAFLYAGVFGDGRQTVENQVRQRRELALAREFAILRELGAKKRDGGRSNHPFERLTRVLRDRLLRLDPSMFDCA